MIQGWVIPQKFKIHFLVPIPLNTSLDYKGLINPIEHNLPNNLVAPSASSPFNKAETFLLSIIKHADLTSS